VAVHYHGTLDDGSVFDSSLDGSPLEFVVGSGQVIPGFDAAVDGLMIDESVTVRIPAAEAYGEVVEDATIEFPVASLPAEIALGDRIEDSDGNAAIVQAINGDTATLLVSQVQHPLAGQALTFELTLVEIK
jgi:peptidylprolyl isomerase